MDYKIGEIASMLGISISALRFFEERGMVFPKRDSENSYRMYKPVDLNRLLRIKTYTQCAFSIEETAEIMCDSDLGVLADRYRDKLDALEDQIIWEQRRLSFMRHSVDELDYARSMLGKWTFRTRPAMYCLPFRTTHHIKTDAQCRKLIKQWTQLKPFSESLDLISEEELMSGGCASEYGLLIEERNLGNFQISENEHILYYPKREHCAFTVYTGDTSRSENTVAEFLGCVMAELREQGYGVGGETIGRVLHTSAASGESLQFTTEFWIPLKTT